MAEKFEAWAPVSGYEGLYEVSDLGRVRRIGKAARTGKGHGGGARIGRCLKPQKHKGGYLHVELWKDGNKQQFLLHVLVALTFLGPPPAGTEVNHDDGDKTNCARLNLEYLTRSENMKHAYRTGLRMPQIGERAPRAKLSNETAIEINGKYKTGGHTLRSLGKEYGVDHKSIYHIVSGNGWKGVV
jgi:hypothetical protein